MSDREALLGDIAELIRGVSYRPTDLLTDGVNAVALLRATNIGNRTLELTDVLRVPSELVRGHQLLRRFDVVIAMSSGSRLAVGRLAQLRQDWAGCVGAFCAAIRPDPKAVHPEYLGYVLQSPEFRARIETYAVGTAIMNLSRERLFGFPLRLPELADQRAIAHILGTLDDKIELNRRMNETLEAMARALFKSWFVDFDPVRAKAEGRDPGLPQPLADLFPDSFEDSELGEIPTGWSLSPLSELAGYLSRGLGPSYIDVGGICVLNQKCIRNCRVDFSKARRHDSSKRSTEGRLLRVHDVLVNSTGVGTLGRVAQLWDLPEPAIVDSHVTVVRAAAGIDPQFLGIALTGREVEVEALGEGSTGQTELSRGRLGALSFVTPLDSLQAAFGRLVEPLLSRLARNERTANTLTGLRDTLLPHLISGELRVKDPARFLGDDD